VLLAGVPFLFFGAQVFLAVLQKYPCPHWLDVVQLFRQPEVAEHSAPWQSSGIGVGHFPFPSQVTAGVKTFPSALHDAAPHS